MMSEIETCEWLPIETAPKDGTRVLLYVPPYGPSTGHYREHNWGEGISNWYAHSLLNKEAEPSHWMPLPNSPTAWNTRTPDPRVTQLVEAARAEIGDYDMDQSDEDMLRDKVSALEAYIFNVRTALKAMEQSDD